MWDRARSLWNGVNNFTQQKIDRRDVSEGDLFVQAFSDDAPAAGASRLRPVGGKDDSKTAKSRRRGLRDYTAGLYALLRNPLAHGDPTADIPQHEALEQLAAFSVLARAVDDALLDRL